KTKAAGGMIGSSPTRTGAGPCAGPIRMTTWLIARSLDICVLQGDETYPAQNLVTVPDFEPMLAVIEYGKADHLDVSLGAMIGRHGQQQRGKLIDHASWSHKRDQQLDLSGVRLRY